MLTTVNGLVIRLFPTGDHDTILHILTEDRGRISVMVKGARSHRGSKSGLSMLAQPFAYANFELYRSGGGDLYYLRGGSILEHFFHLTADFPRMALASYLCEATDVMVGDSFGPDTNTLLRMLLNALYVLNRGTYDYKLVKGVFELRAAALAGYQPDLTVCTSCKQAFPDAAFFDIMNGRFVCEACQAARRPRAIALEEMRDEAMRERRIICPVSASVLAAMRYALTAPDRKIFSFSLTDREEIESFERVAETYFLNHLEEDFESLKFYRTAEKQPATVLHNRAKLPSDLKQ